MCVAYTSQVFNKLSPLWLMRTQISPSSGNCSAFSSQVLCFAWPCGVLLYAHAALYFTPISRWALCRFLEPCLHIAHSSLTYCLTNSSHHSKIWSLFPQFSKPAMLVWDRSYLWLLTCHCTVSAANHTHQLFGLCHWSTCVCKVEEELLPCFFSVFHFDFFLLLKAITQRPATQEPKHHLRLHVLGSLNSCALGSIPLVFHAEGLG